MKRIKINKRKGILFYIQGLSGSGKSSVGQKIKKQITKLYGPTLLISGDNLRKIFELYDYSYSGRLCNAKKFNKLAKFLTDQKINLILTIVGMFHATRNWNKRNISNYIEIYIKSDIKKIINFKKKKIYRSRKTNNIVGLTIKPEFPKNPNIIIKNNFKKPSDYLAQLLFKKLKSLIKN